jgi:hypothetical protein
MFLVKMSGVLEYNRAALSYDRRIKDDKGN